MDNKHHDVSGYSHNCIQCHADGENRPTIAGTLPIFVAFQNPWLYPQPGQRPPQRSLQQVLNN